MLDRHKIAEIAERHLRDSKLFLVEVKAKPANEYEVLIDSEEPVSIESCVVVSRAIEGELDRDEEDFALTVMSAGIGQPLKVFRQYTKLIGRPVEVILKSGVKVVARLKEATPESITLVYEEMVPVEGKKRKESVEIIKTYALDEVKSTIEYLDFK